MRRFVLAPLLALEAAVLAGLVAISLVAAVREDLTALLYGAIFAALAALAVGTAAGLAGRRLPRVPRPAAAAFTLLAAATAVAAGGLAWWGLSALAATPDPRVPDGDPCCTHPDTWGDIAESAGVGAALAVAAVGMAVAAFASARYAVTSQPPRALAQSLAALGILLVLGFVAALVINGVVRGDYP